MKKSVKTSSFTLIIGFVCVALIGAALLPLLPISLYPTKSSPSLTVTFSLPGSEARGVELEVTSRLEAMLARMKGVKSISSRSRVGGGSISVKLDKHTDLEMLRFEASTIVRQIWPMLPHGTSYPQVKVNSPDDNADKPLLTYTINAPASPAVIQAYAEEHLLPVLGRIKGVYNVKMSGATPMEWRLEYDPHQLSTLGLTPEAIRSAIRSYFSTSSLGMVACARREGDEGAESSEKALCDYRSITVRNAPTNLSRLPIEEISVKSIDGRVIGLAEVVKVSHVETQPQSFYRINGLNSIYLTISSEENANQLTVGEAVKSKMKAIADNLPAGYETHIGYDATEVLNEELNTIYFRSSLTVAILLLFILLISRRWKYLLVVTLSLLINLLIAVGIYYLVGVEIQLYSLAGITISLNLIIDNTIVMADHLMHRHNLKTYLSILTATLTTVCALAVVLFLNEDLRRSLQDFSIVLIINLMVSLAVALFFVPSLMDRIEMNATKGKGGKRWMVAVSRCYAWLIGFTCRHRAPILWLMLLSFGLPVFLLPDKMKDDEGWHGWYNATLGSEYYKENIRPIVNAALGGTWRLFVEKVYNGSYFSSDQEVVLHVNASLPNGSTIEQMNTLIGKMEDFLKGREGIKQFQTRVQSPYQASIDIYFLEEFKQTHLPYQLKTDITSQALQLGGGSWSIYGLEDQAFNNSVRETAGSYRVRLYGYNYDRLYQYAETLRDSLMTYRRVRDVEINSSFSWYKSDYRELHFDLLHDNVAEADLTPSELFVAMKNIFSRDLYCGSFHTDDGKYEAISLSSSKATEYDSWQLQQSALKSGSKEFKLHHLADIGIMPQAKEVVKNNQQYTLCLQYDYIGAFMMGEKVLQREVKELNEKLPPGYSAKVDAQRQRWREEDNSQYLLLLIVAGVIFLITSILFNSLRRPLAILSLIPMSYIGVFLTFWLFELNFDQGGFAAFVLLCGITVNAGIYLLDEYADIRQRQPLLSPTRAYLKAWNVKITPILLTIFSTILGFIPFMVGTEQEAFWFPLAAGTIGGLITSLIALYLLLPMVSLPRKHRCSPD